jgi:hypothetical protein
MAAIRRGDRAEVRRMVNAGARVNNRHLNAAPNQNMVMILRPNYANSSNNNERTPPPRARNAARSPGAPRRQRPLTGIPAYNNFSFNTNYTGPIYGNNVTGLANEPAARAPNYSKASKYLKKWLEARPHEIRMNQVRVKLPVGASDPISLKNFTKGNEAIMVLKKDVRNGALRTKRYFLEKNVLARLARKPWRSVIRMKASDVVFKDPINRRSVYRRNLMNVKFI